MRFGTALHLATLATGGAAFAAAAIGGNLHPLFTVAWIVGFVLAAIVPEDRFKGGLVLAVGLLAGPALGAAILSLGLDPVLGAVYFASLLLLARLFTRSGTDGHGQAHLLSILVLAGGAAISPDLTYLLVFICYLFTLTFALLLVHLRREAGEAALALPAREVVGRGLITGTLILSIFALVFTGVVFIFFPRATFGLGMARAAGSDQVGLTDRIELAGFGSLKDNDRVVLRVHSQDGVAAGGTLDLYWRARALEIYDGHGWSAAERPMEASSSSVVRFSPGDDSAGRYFLNVEVVSNLGIPVLVVPDNARTVRVHPRDGRGGRIALRQVAAREVRTVGAPSPPYGFEVEVEPYRAAVDHEPPGPEDLELPEQHPAIVSLAARLLEESGSDVERLPESLERWLSTRFSYSAELPRDPSLEHFLLERQEGHCEYFATAMVVLLRLNGVPSRVVVGFSGGRWNAAGGYHTVRQGDAHAWVEVWREGAGWRRYEPTPPAGIGRGIEPPDLGERLADLWDSLQAAWSRNVLSFDRAAQRSFLRNVMSTVDDMGRAFQGGGGDRGPLLRVVGSLVAGIILVAAVVVLRRRILREDPAEELGPDARRAQRVYRALLRSLHKAGIERLPHQTAEEVLAGLHRAMPMQEGDLVHRAESLIGRYDASRFGGRPMPPEEARELTREARMIAKEVKSACR